MCRWVLCTPPQPPSPNLCVRVCVCQTAGACPFCLTADSDTDRRRGRPFFLFFSLQLAHKSWRAVTYDAHFQRLTKKFHVTLQQRLSGETGKTVSSVLSPTPVYSSATTVPPPGKKDSGRMDAWKVNRSDQKHCFSWPCW